MPGKRVNLNLIKTHFSYTASELAKRLGIHKNTVRNWMRAGLPCLGGRPALFHGGTVRAFLSARNARRRQPCPPGFLYCFRCRDRRKPALGLVDYVDRENGAGNLTAICESCGAIMNRRAGRDRLGAIMPGLDVQIRQAAPTLVGSLDPSLNCGSKEQRSA
ncbi:helix-turn-helix domain-containing protein [Methylocella sp.]|uniref:helix-turn-helix domain-containing protein n=1 Tax=Methylocella sp. TaxID=1978226 RepID=UPI00378328A3